MKYIDLGIYYLFNYTIIGYGIVGYVIYQVSEKLTTEKSKIPLILTIICLFLSFWYLRPIPMKHWREFVSGIIKLDKNYGKVLDQGDKVIITLPREVVEFGGKDRHLLEDIKIIYPSRNSTEKRLLEVDCKEKTIEESIPTDEILHTGKTYKKVNIFNEEILNGEYLFLLNSDGFPIERKINDYEYKEFCEYDWTYNKENIKSELLKQIKSESTKEKNK